MVKDEGVELFRYTTPIFQLKLHKISTKGFYLSARHYLSNLPTNLLDHPNLNEHYQEEKSGQ